MTQQTEPSQKPDYRKTLNLPKTSFPMKANLVQNEPASMKRWAQIKLYETLRERRAGSPRYSFHDGPPYANGSIHLGHLLNKVLKDIIARWKNLEGFDCPYVPGWDCHGLPIEHRVMQTMQKDRSQESGDGDPGEQDVDAMQVRRACRKYAQKYIKLQSKQMQRLLTLADYEHPYLTMDPAYEAAVLEVFAELVAKKLVYRGLKPVHWSIANRTALAEAELEYYDREDDSIYVLFEIHSFTGDKTDKLDELQNCFLMIWTTTPWTLPANLAVAVHPNYEYGLYPLDDGRKVILAVDLAEKVLKKAVQPIRTFQGRQLNISHYIHPFMKDKPHRPVVLADYVTLEDGTGLVHTAPGHGTDDYKTYLYSASEYGLDPTNIYCPVRDDGTFDETVPDWLQGKSVWEANPLVVEHLRQSGHLFHAQRFTHSYPHDWRSKTPVIFRATEQWFVNVDLPFKLDGEPDIVRPRNLRNRALVAVGLDFSDPQTPAQFEAQRQLNNLQDNQSGLFPKLVESLNEDTPEELDRLRTEIAVRDEVQKIDFFPEWGRNRMRGMLESRPDWCLSRQRAWGLPIPAFYNEQGEALLTRASILAVSDFLRQRGSDAWFKAEPHDILEKYEAQSDSDAPDWIKQTPSIQTLNLTKSTDIFDVWFESGSSWHAVMRQRFGDDWFPTDLYLEGSDQHRGWFQLSLLPALGATGQTPFKNVLTHGFMVDKDGRKMSKSVGNTLEVDELFKNYGADVCRWWVSSLNSDNDIKVDESFFKLAGEEYRKVRNTIRFLMSNLGDFDPKAHRYAFTQADATSIDAWVIGKLNQLIQTVNDAMQTFHLRKIHEALFQFCNETQSAVYLTAVKDRLYCDDANSPRRRRTQTAMYDMLNALLRLLAPILPHTADEAWRALKNDDSACVHLETLPKPIDIPISKQWSTVMTARDRWLKTLEDARQQMDVDNPLDCALTAPCGEGMDRFDVVDLADLCSVSRFQWRQDGENITVSDLSDQPRCDRSWKRDGTVKQRADGGMLSDRDAEALDLA